MPGCAGRSRFAAGPGSERAARSHARLAAARRSIGAGVHRRLRPAAQGRAGGVDRDGVDAGVSHTPLHDDIGDHDVTFVANHRVVMALVAGVCSLPLHHAIGDSVVKRCERCVAM
jgi:hypothetical protein